LVHFGARIPYKSVPVVRRRSPGLVVVLMPCGGTGRELRKAALMSGVE
jgi:hypothetical protein